MTRYKLSDGTYINKSVLDARISQAKVEKLRHHLDKYDYYFCTTCKQNDCKPIDVAHIKSVNDCQKDGCAEMAYNLDNLVIEGRKCHEKRDKLYIYNYGK